MKKKYIHFKIPYVTSKDSKVCPAKGTGSNIFKNGCSVGQTVGFMQNILQMKQKKKMMKSKLCPQKLCQLDNFEILGTSTDICSNSSSVNPWLCAEE